MGMLDFLKKKKPEPSQIDLPPLPQDMSQFPQAQQVEFPDIKIDMPTLELPPAPQGQKEEAFPMPPDMQAPEEPDFFEMPKSDADFEKLMGMPWESEKQLPPEQPMQPAQVAPLPVQPVQQPARQELPPVQPVVPQVKQTFQPLQPVSQLTRPQAVQQPKKPEQKGIGMFVAEMQQGPEPVYISYSRFQYVMETINSLAKEAKLAEDTIYRLKEINDDKDEVVNTWQTALEQVEKELVDFDQTLFG